MSWGTNLVQFVADLASTAAGKGAALIGINDTGSLITATTVEAALQELRTTLRLKAATTLTIATGAVTATQTHHKIDTESSASSDDLDTISGGAEGQIICVRIVNNARDVVLKHNTGNIQCPQGMDITLDVTVDRAWLEYDGTNWVVVAFRTTAAGGGGLGAYLASTASGKGASAIGINDTGNLITATTVEAALQELVVPAATDTTAGKVELATNAEAVTGTDTARAVTPAGVAAAIAAAPGGIPGVWYGHYPQDTSHAKTDYFDDASLNVKWTELDNTSKLTVTEDATHRLKLLKSASASDEIAGLFQTAPAAVQYTITAHFKVSGTLRSTSTHIVVGIFIAGDLAGAPTTADLVNWVLSRRGTGPEIDLEATWYADYNGGGGATAVSGVGTVDDVGAGDIWLRIYVDTTGNFYHFLMSNDGEVWIECGRVAQASAGLTTDPATIGVLIQNINTPLDAAAYFDAFIVKDTSDPYHSVGGRS